MSWLKLVPEVETRTAALALGQEGVGQEQPVEQIGVLGGQPKADEPAPVLAEQVQWAAAALARSGGQELPHPLHMALVGVGRALHRLVRATEPDQIGHHRSVSGGNKRRDHLAVQILPSRLPVQQQKLSVPPLAGRLDWGVSMSLVEGDRLSGRSGRRSAKEFKVDAVALVLGGDRPIAHVARELGMGETSLGNWVRQAGIDGGEKPGLATAERAELAELRREVAKLRMGRGLPCEQRRSG